MLAYANTGNQYEQYKQQSAMTASPGELTLMLYDGCIKFLRMFKMYVEEKDFIKANVNSQKAQAIVAELMNSLDMKYPISKELYALYDFIVDRMVKANVKKNLDDCDVALEMVIELRDTWQQVIKINRAQAFGNVNRV